MTGTMQTVKLLGSSSVEVRDVPIPEPGPGEALIRIAISAICGSELPGYHRPGPAPDLPYNTGHEMGGVVVRSNGLCRVSEGQRVGLQIFSGCGQCRHCLQGDPEHCVKGPKAVLNADSEYVVAPEVCLIPLPDDLDWEAGVLMAGDPIGTPYHALQRMGGVHAGQTAAIFGFGPIGQGFMALLRYYGVRTIVSELGAYRRELAAKLGASLVLDPSKEDVAARVRAETNGGADISLDCSHHQETFTAALDARACMDVWGGSAKNNLQRSTPASKPYAKNCRLPPPGISLSRIFTRNTNSDRRGLSLDGLITHRFDLADAAEAYRLFSSGQTGKVVFRHTEVV